MARGYFVTGTSTGVGKTLVSCALLHAFNAAGQIAVAMKPVAAGSEDGKWMDVEMLTAASAVVAARNHMNPYALHPAIAPHIAAHEMGIKIDIEVIRNSLHELQRSADLVIVEGAGGFLVPLNEHQGGDDMALALNLPVILVVGMQLGCLNHALLTARAVRATGLTLSGWIANRIDPDMAVFDENVLALDRRLGCPLLGVLPFDPGADPKKLAGLLEIRKISPEPFGI
ncbi:MAG TPA: dethiobiotin synthase [Nitrosospira sp.]|nr:dethiobiotin synthase [Nitrosospira sp.]